MYTIQNPLTDKENLFWIVKFLIHPLVQTKVVRCNILYNPVVYTTARISQGLSRCVLFSYMSKIVAWLRIIFELRFLVNYPPTPPPKSTLKLTSHLV